MEENWWEAAPLAYDADAAPHEKMDLSGLTRLERNSFQPDYRTVALFVLGPSIGFIVLGWLLGWTTQNLSLRGLLSVYLLIIVGVFLFPPWVVYRDAGTRGGYSTPIEHRFISDLPRLKQYESASVDFGRLFLTLAAVSAAAGIAALWLVKRPRFVKRDHEDV